MGRDWTDGELDRLALTIQELEQLGGLDHVLGFTSDRSRPFTLRELVEQARAGDDRAIAAILDVSLSGEVMEEPEPERVEFFESFFANQG